ncbi:MAG: lipopolysaccharide biosynthesis protein [Gemmatimonadales bacterium]
MSVLRRGGLAAAGLFSMGACKLLAAWSIARGQGPAVQGAFSIALACTSFGGIVLGMGFEYANAYVVGRTASRLGAVVANTLLLTAVGLVLAPLWVAGFGSFVPALYLDAAVDWRTLAAVAAATALTVATQGLQAAAIGHEDIRGVAIANLVTGVLWGIVSFGAARVSYLALLGGWIVTLAGQAAFYLVRLGWRPGRDGGDRAVFREQAAFGMKTVPGSASRALNMRAGLYAASMSLSRELVGVYGVIITLSEALLYIPNAFGQVILGSTARQGRRAPSFLPAYAVVAAIGGAAVVTALIGGRYLLGAVFGPEYRVGATALSLLLLAATVHAIGLLRLHHYLGAGRPAAASRAQVVALVLTLLGVVVLIPRFGLVGAAAATLTAYSGFTAYLFLQRPASAEVPAPSLSRAG